MRRLILHTLLLVTCICTLPASVLCAGDELPPRRVLACLFGPDRATSTTFASFLRNVVNPLDADLCGAVSTRRKDKTQWHGAAAVLQVYAEPLNLSTVVSPLALHAATNTSEAYLLHDNFLRPRGFRDMWAKHQLLKALQAAGALAHYSWFYFGRTDLHYLAPVPDVTSAEGAGNSIWVPWAGQAADRHGLYDDAALVPVAWVDTFLRQLDTVAAGGDPAFLTQLKPLSGTGGSSTTAQHFLAQYLAYHHIPVRRFDFTAYTTAAGGASSSLVAARSTVQVNLDTGHIYRNVNQYLNAVNHAMEFYHHLHAVPGGEQGGDAAAAVDDDMAQQGERLFYLVTIEQAERINATLRNCALSAWGMAVYERLLSHPWRTKHVARASVAFAPPHFGWDLHWPTPNGNRDGNAARKDANFPLPKEEGGYEPYGSALATSCRSWFSPCGYEGCVPAFGKNALAAGLASGAILSKHGVLAVLGQLFNQASLKEGAQRLVIVDSGAPGPVAYRNQTGGVDGYDLPAEAYRDGRFIFALASSREPLFRPGVDVSMPTPWSEDTGRFMLSRNRSACVLTFKGSFQTTAGKHGNDLRARVGALLHDPGHGIVVVDRDSEEGKTYDYRELMYNTVFTLIMRGDQLYSYRYTEAVCSGAVPVLLSTDGWVPPFSNLHPFSDYGVVVTEAELPQLVARLRAMPVDEVERLRNGAKNFCLHHLVTVHAQTDSLVASVLGRT